MPERPYHYEKIRQFKTGATRDTDTDQPDYDGYLSPLVLRRFGQYMTKHRKQSDGKLRDSDNWQKGIPVAEYRKSLCRHWIGDVWPLSRGCNGETTQDIEEALCAVLFNCQGMLHEILTKKDSTED